MHFKKSLLIGLLCMLVTVIGLFCFAGCSSCNPDNGDDGDDGTTDIGTDIGEVEEACDHTYGEWYVETDATCNSEGVRKRVCSKCQNAETSAITKLSHKFTVYTSNNDATCTRDGTKTAVCDNDGCEQTNTVADAGTKTGHHFETNLIAAATCVTHGSEERVCTNEGCDFREERQILARGHVWDNVERTCTLGQTCTVDGCGASLPALGHAYSQTHIERTCTTDGGENYTCDRCGDHYATITERATGHVVLNWNEANYDINLTADGAPDGDTCRYTVIYSGICEECGHEVSKSEAVERHNLVQVIVRQATCRAAGATQMQCRDCDYCEDEIAYENADAHHWNNGVEEDGVLTKTCSVCEKQLISYTENNAVINTQTLSEVGAVQMNNTTIAPDEATLSGLGENSVQLSVGTVDLNSIDNLDPDLASQIQGEVYEFTMTIINFNAADGENVTNFAGEVTVTLPYTLTADDDAEAVAIWFIDDDGTPTTILAKYFEDSNGDGFVTFKTSHFSKYTVTRLTAAERCVLYNHSYKTTTVETSCTVDGYTLRVCQRCGITEYEEGERAYGHNLISNPDKTDVQATCTTDGYEYFICEHDCGYTYTHKTAATGHGWVEGEGSVTATCQTAGHATYTCSLCQATYTETITQLQHRYKTEVLAATCTEGGHTTYTCDYCAHSYVGDYTEALGHTYVSSIVSPTCTENGYTLHTCSLCGDDYRTDEVAAAHSWDIQSPTCGKGQICLICGATGAAATGAHTMVNGVCSVCGTGCEHTNTVTNYPATCTEAGYKLRACTKCGREEKFDYTPALGHDGVITCSRCHLVLIGEEFFTNGISSLINNDFAVRAKDVHISVSDLNYIIDFAEMFITYDKNGELYGYASGTLTGSDSYIPESMTANAYAVITNGNIYVKASLPQGMNSSQDGAEFEYIDTAVFDIYLVIPFEKLDMEALASNEISYQLIPMIYEAFQTQVKPLLNSLLSVNGTDISSVTAQIISKYCTIERSGSGYVITLDNSELKQLYEDLKTKNIAELIDIILGEDTYEDLRQTVNSVLESTIDVNVRKLIQRGISFEEILDIADQVCILVTGSTLEELTGRNISSYLDLLENQDLLAMTGLEVINRYIAFSEGVIGAFVPTSPDGFTEEDYSYTLEDINGYIDEYAEMNVFDLIAAEFGISKDEIISEINGYVDTVIDGLSVKLYTDIYGNVTGGDLNVEETVLDLGEKIAFSGTLTLTDKVSSNVNYVEIAEEVKEIGESFELTVPIIKASFPNAEITTYDSGLVKTVSGTESEERLLDSWYEENYEYRNIVRSTRTYSYEYGENPICMMIKDCGSWYYIQAMAERYIETRSSQRFTQVFENGVLVDEYDEGHGEDVYTPYSRSVGFYYNVLSQRVIADGENSMFSEGRHNFVEDATKFVPCGDDCYDWGERHFYCTYCGKTRTQYFAHGHNRAERFEPLSGDTITNCEDGYYRITYCTVCDEELYRSIENYHYVYASERVDLSGYDVCERHYFNVESCPCGEYKYIHFGVGGHVNGEQTGIDSFMDTYYCEECGLTLTVLRTHVASLISCIEQQTELYTLSFNGNVLGTFTRTETYASHRTETYVKLKDGAQSCEDGIIVSRICTVCGEKEYEYETYGHEYGITEVIDLEEYGAVCGEKLYVYGCACGERDDGAPIYDIRASGYTDFSLIDESSYNHDREVADEDGSYYIIYDSMSVYQCTVTDPEPCNLRFAEKRYMSESGCEAYLTILIGCDRNGENAAYEVTYLIQTKHCYTDIDETDLGNCRFKITHTCIRCGDSYETQEMRHTIVGGLTHISGCRYGYHCAVCGAYVDTVYIHDEEWVDVSECESRLTCKVCGHVSDVRYTHTYEWKNVGGCRWENTCTKCGEVESFEYRHDWTVDAATCTQFGNMHCEACGIDEILYPTDHIWQPDEFGYHCEACHITNINGASGDVVLEDCSDEFGGGENFVVGFYLDYYNKANQNKYSNEYVLSVTLILGDAAEDENDQILVEGVEVAFNSHGGGNYVEFSKAEVEAWANENGYGARDYEVRLSFVPIGWQCDLDYGITFD